MPSALDGYCCIAKRFLDEQRMPYAEINIDEDETVVQRVEQWHHDNHSIPTLDINGSILTHPTPAQLPCTLGSRILPLLYFRRTPHESPTG
jgi:glutaredoxin